MYFSCLNYYRLERNSVLYEKNAAIGFLIVYSLVIFVYRLVLKTQGHLDAVLNKTILLLKNQD